MLSLLTFLLTPLAYAFANLLSVCARPKKKR